MATSVRCRAVDSVLTVVRRLSGFRRVAGLLAVGVSVSCGGDGATAPGTSASASAPTSADRAKFVGTWDGSYSCPGQATPFKDRLVIRLGTGALDVGIVIHSTTNFPDSIVGTLVAPNTINVPTQTLGGFPGTASLTFNGTLLTYQQSGLGITCGGADYTRTP